MDPVTRTVAEVCAAALLANCGCCWACPGQPCTAPPHGVHVARLARAERRGLISSPELLSVLGALDAFTPESVVAA